jgi:hypothetical protein
MARESHRSIWGNLVGPPVRVSKGLDLGPKRQERDGLVKLRLAHQVKGSVLIPDLLLVMGGHRYLAPSFFGPPVLTFNRPEGWHEAVFSIDAGPPRAPEAARFVVTV